MAGLLLSACASSAPLLKPDVPGQIAVYDLSAGDRLRISVFNEPSLSNDFVVGGNGDISYPLIGNVSVSGKSIPQVQELIRDRLAAGYVKDPRVTVEMTNYRPYYILGEVAHPGQFPYSTGLTITQAIAVAGGYSYRANQRRIFVKRSEDGVERQIDVSKHVAYVLPGDTIRVGERYF